MGNGSSDSLSKIFGKIILAIFILAMAGIGVLGLSMKGISLLTFLTNGYCCCDIWGNQVDCGSAILLFLVFLLTIAASITLGRFAFTSDKKSGEDTEQLFAPH